MNNVKIKLDELVKKYETEDFIKDDPIQFPHKFEYEKDIEIAGFISSLLAYGSRKQFIKKLDELFLIMQNEPLNFIQNFEPKIIGDFNYRFGKKGDSDSTQVSLIHFKQSTISAVSYRKITGFRNQICI